MQKSKPISFDDILIFKEFKKKKDRPLRVLAKTMSKSDDQSEINQREF